MVATKVAVAPTILYWAQDRSGRSDAEFERKFGAWPQWLEGAQSPTVKQVEEIARYSHLPFGVFFLSEPPQVKLPIPDYRLGESGRAAQPSQDLLEVIDSSLQRQGWFRDYAIRHGLGEARIRRYTEAIDIVEVAQQVRDELGFDIQSRTRISRGEVRNHLRHAFEERGGLAIFTSMVGNNTHRPLNREEFRGFTLADDIAPLIFVNTRDDTLSGQIFTFLHEYAHVVRGQSGISDEDLARTESGGVEDWCNSVASEVLVPLRDLSETFRQNVALRDELDRLSSRYECSTLVVLLRLRDGELVGRAGFAELYAAESAYVGELLARRPASEGGDFYLNQPFRIGERLSRAVLHDVYSGGTSYTEALGLFGLRSATQLDKYARQLGLR